MVSLYPTSPLPGQGGIVAPSLGEGARAKSLKQGTEPSATDGGDASAAALYVSPVLQYDSKAKLAVLVVRDSVTGEIEQQIPSRRIVEAYRKQNERIGSSATLEAAEALTTLLTAASGLTGNNRSENLNRLSAVRMSRAPTSSQDKLSVSV